MLRNALTILYMNPTKPCKFQCQQKESQQITNMEIEQNNTVNKTNIKVNDLNLAQIQYYPANDEKQGEAAVFAGVMKTVMLECSRLLEFLYSTGYSHRFQ